jgi:hypothetical protein
MHNYIGITYPSFFQNNIMLKFFKKYFCKKHIHLFDEVKSKDSHYLHCDACGLEVHINKIITNKIITD